MIKQIVVVGEVFKGCGRAIFEGLRRFLSMMCFFVVRRSHIGVSLDSAPSSESSPSAKRSFFVAEAAEDFALLWMCLRRAVEAFKVWEGQSIQ